MTKSRSTCYKLQSIMIFLSLRYSFAREKHIELSKNLSPTFNGDGCPDLITNPSFRRLAFSFANLPYKKVTVLGLLPTNFITLSVNFCQPIFSCDLDFPFSTVRIEFINNTFFVHFSREPDLGLTQFLSFRSHSNRSNIFRSEGLIFFELNARPFASLGKDLDQRLSLKYHSVEF